MKCSITDERPNGSHIKADLHQELSASYDLTLYKHSYNSGEFCYSKTRAGPSTRRAEFHPGDWLNDTARGEPEVTGQKPVPVTLCRPDATRTGLALNAGLRDVTVAANRMNHRTAFGPPSAFVCSSDSRTTEGTIRQQHQPSGLQ